MTEDFTPRDPLELPPVGVAPEKQAEGTQSQVVVSTAGGAVLVGAGSLITSLLGYITNIVMTHMVIPSVYGIFVEITAVVSVVSNVAQLGLDDTILRFLSTYRTTGEWGLAASLTRFAVRLTLSCGFICGVLLYLLSSLLAHYVYHQDVYAFPLKEVALLIPLMGLQSVLASSLQALKAIKWMVYINSLIRPLILILLFIFYLFGLRLEALIFATIGGYIASTLAGRVFLGKAMKTHVQERAFQFARMTWIRFTIPMFFNTMIYYILNSTSILFLGVFATTSQIALYGVADRISTVVLIPLGTLNVIFPPLIAEYYTRGEHQQLASMFKTVTRWSFSLSWPLFLCCLVFHDAILGVFGEKYITAGLVLIILSLGVLVDSAVGSVGYLLRMTGRSRIVLANAVATLIVNIVLISFLAPRFTIIGAAIAAALAEIIINIAGLIEIYWIMRIHPYRWDILKPIIAGGVASVVGVLLLRISPVSYGWLAIFTALALVLSFMIVYVLALALLGFSAEDTMVFDAVRAKLGKKKSKRSLG